MILFLTGALMMGFFTAGLFFLRFWRDTADRLFAFFGISFFLMGLERIFLAMCNGSETTPYIYLLRVTAFILLIVGIVDKNRVPN